MGKLEKVIQFVETQVEERKEFYNAEHTDTTHTDYNDNCGLLF